VNTVLLSTGSTLLPIQTCWSHCGCMDCIGESEWR